MSRPPLASMAGHAARALVEVVDDLAALESGGRWAVAIPYAGRPVLARFAEWTVCSDVPAGPWVGPDAASWESSLDEAAYCAGVERIRSAIEAGTVYQANLCRVLRASMPQRQADDVAGLHRLLREGNPSPHGGFLRLPQHDVAVVSASPELFLSVVSTPEGRVVTSGPIKGTGATVEDLTEKDAAENVMIVDLVRNDLSRLCVPGTVTVPALLEVEEHPGLVHLVSRVQGALRADVTWAEVFAAAFPPGSVTGAPKSSALRIIDDCESESREFYCGAFGWIDADTGEAELAVAIRTFWLREGVLRFGTGAGITWSSDARREWEETQLKARRLVEVASGSWPGDGS